MEPMMKARIDSSSVIHRCRQIEPSANHFTIRIATSTGFEKKNGGSSVTPKIGRVNTCHSRIATTATSSCRITKVTRDIIRLRSARSL
jgi:hypothetical protein